MTIDEATEIMRNMVNDPPAEQCRAMMVLADVWEEAERVSGCHHCGAQENEGTWCYPTDTNGNCITCSGTKFVSNGNSLRAEALRLLAECGMVGRSNFGYGGPGNDRKNGSGMPLDWYMAAIYPLRLNGEDFHDVIVNRLGLVNAYASADRPTSEAWARETRKLAGWVECSCNEGEVRVGKWLTEWIDCLLCHGTGLVPPDHAEVQS